MYENLDSLYQAKRELDEYLFKAKDLSGPITKEYNDWSSVKAKAAVSAKVKYVIRERELFASFELLLKEGYSAYKKYREILEEINDSYIGIIFSEENRVARRKLEREAESFRRAEERNQARLDRAYAPFTSYYTESESEEGEVEILDDIPFENPQGASYNDAASYGIPQYQYNPCQQQNVNIAPVNLDISAIVENAVRSAMGKFSSALDARINSYVGQMPKIPHRDGGAPTSDVIVEMAGKVADDEKFVLDKLIELLGSLKDVGERLSSLSLLCNEILEKERIAADGARRVNDMQRQLSRELQAATATQKVIANDQAAVTESQHEVFEQQKAALESQNTINEAQKAISLTQLSVMEAQKRIERNMRQITAKKEAEIQKPAPIEEAPPVEPVEAPTPVEEVTPVEPVEAPTAVEEVTPVTEGKTEE